MKRHLRTAVYAAALLLGSVSVDAILSSASAQADVSVSFDSFHNQLAQYGDWVYSDRWGEVWVPGDVSDDFHPYGTRGHWVNTDEYGWTWVSGYEWGDIPFHYGRWVNDPDDGWMWIPGYVWSPGWVVWRNNGQYTGWMPMPPDDEFLGRGPSTSIGVSIGGLSVRFNNTDDNYGYSRWYGRDYSQDRFASNWVFVGTGHIGETDYGRYQAPRSNYTTLIRDSHNITNYTVVNNYVVNRSVDPRTVQQAGGHVQTVHASVVIKRPQFVARADAGSQVQARMRTERPRGTGLAGSAPKPTAAQIQSLSTKAPPAHGGKPPAHLFTRDTVVKAPLAEKPGTSAPTANGSPQTLTPAERKDAKHGIVPTTETPPGKSEVKTPPAMETHAPGMTAEPKSAPVTPAETPHEKKAREHMTPPGDAPVETPPGKSEVKTPPAMETHAPGMTVAPKNAPVTPEETPREKRAHEHMTPPGDTTAPAETPREHEHVQKPVTEMAPATPPQPAAETPRVPRHPPVTEAPAMTAHPAAPVEHPKAVEPPKRPEATETHAPAQPGDKKEKKPKQDEPGEGH